MNIIFIDLWIFAALIYTMVIFKNNFKNNKKNNIFIIIVVVMLISFIIFSILVVRYQKDICNTNTIKIKRN